MLNDDRERLIKEIEFYLKTTVEPNVFAKDFVSPHPYVLLSKAFAALRLTTCAVPDGRDGWFDIETAPKDGRTILAWGPYSLEPFTVQWRRDEWCPIWDGNTIIESESDFGTTYKNADPLTHWRPLPAPPAQEDR